jgi:hypothetical protein
MAEKIHTVKNRSKNDSFLLTDPATGILLIRVAVESRPQSMNFLLDATPHNFQIIFQDTINQTVANARAVDFALNPAGLLEDFQVLGYSRLCKRKRIHYVATNAFIVQWSAGKHSQNLDTCGMCETFG